MKVNIFLKSHFETNLSERKVFPPLSRTERIYRLSSVGFPGGSVVKNLPAKLETWVQSLGQEDPLEKEIATHFSILAWEIPWTEEFSSVQSLSHV